MKPDFHQRCRKYAIKNKNTISAINVIKKLSSVGVPAVEIIMGINEHIRYLLYAGVEGGHSLLDMNDELAEKYVNASCHWDRMDLLQIGQVLSDLSSTIRRSDNPYLILEMTVLKLLEMDASVHINELLQQIKTPGVVFPKPVSSEKIPIPRISEKPTEKVKPEEQKVKKIQPSAKKKIMHEDSDSRSDKIDEKENLDRENSKKVAEEQEKENTSINYSLDDISNNWPTILTHITELRPSIGTILDNSKPVQLNNDFVQIQLSGQSSFSIKMLERHLQWMENEIVQNTSLSLKLKFSQEENDTIKADTNGKKNESHGNQEDHSETVNKIIELFDGEILRN